MSRGGRRSQVFLLVSQAGGWEEGIENDDQVHHAGDGGKERTYLVDLTDTARGGELVQSARFGELSIDLQYLLVDLIGDDGDRANHDLSDEPETVFFGVDDIDAADEQAAEEEPEDTGRDAKGPLGFSSEEVARPWEEDGQQAGEEVKLGSGLGGHWHGGIGAGNGVACRVRNSSRGETLGSAARMAETGSPPDLQEKRKAY